MTFPAILNDARAAGVTLWAEGDALRYRGPREALANLKQNQRLGLRLQASPEQG